MANSAIASLYLRCWSIPLHSGISDEGIEADEDLDERS
jgi:hypothetical protein